MHGWLARLGSTKGYHTNHDRARLREVKVERWEIVSVSSFAWSFFSPFLLRISVTLYTAVTKSMTTLSVAVT
jgi:hypothetical protein